MKDIFMENKINYCVGKSTMVLCANNQIIQHPKKLQTMNDLRSIHFPGVLFMFWNLVTQYDFYFVQIAVNFLIIYSKTTTKSARIPLNFPNL